MRVNQLIGFLAQFQEHSIYAEKFRTFVTQKPQIINGTEKAEAFESLELRHVSFTYPFPEKEPQTGTFGRFFYGSKRGKDRGCRLQRRGENDANEAFDAAV